MLDKNYAADFDMVYGKSHDNSPECNVSLIKNSNLGVPFDLHCETRCSRAFSSFTGVRLEMIVCLSDM